jgi:DNA-binding transcriptional LysR family regulator
MGGRSDFLSGVMAVLAVARAGSFRQAMRGGSTGFRKLYNEIKSVEQTLGCLVFHRTVDGVVLTPEGKMILEHATRIETILNDLQRLGKSMGKEQAGDVMLAATEGLGTFWISPRLEDFRKANEGLNISLHPSMALVDMRRFEIDLALQVVEPIHPEIRRLRLGTLHMVPSASPEYIARHGMPETLEDLDRHRFVFHVSPQSSDRQIVERAIGKQLRREQCIDLRNSSAHYMTIEHGEGIGFLPSYGFAIGAKTMPLNLPLRYSLGIWLCFHELSRSIPRVSLAIDWLIAIFDPKLYPWFRREFVPPKRFSLMISEQGIEPLVDPFAFGR